VEELLLSTIRVNDVRQIEIYTAEPLVSDPSHFEVETVIGENCIMRGFITFTLRQV
jgi:hypothetical protein